MQGKFQNALINNAQIGFIDNGTILTIWLNLDLADGSNQSFGGIKLVNSEKNLAGRFISRTMKVVGVREWSELVGKHIRVDATLSKIHGIGNILKDDWFYPEREFYQQEDKRPEYRG